MVGIFDNAGAVKQVKHYFSLLEDYRRVLDKYQKKVDAVNISEEDKMAAVQVALDLTYLKEGLDELKPNQDQLSKEITSLREAIQEVAQTQSLENAGKMEEVIQNSVKQVCEAKQRETFEICEQLMDGMKRKSRWIFAFLIGNLICSAALIGILLYLLGVISF